MEKTDCVVIGAGVIGLSIARELADTGREVIIIEAESAIGSHTSSRNTGCIHAGIAHPRNSLKSQLCQSGKNSFMVIVMNAGSATENVGNYW